MERNAALEKYNTSLVTELKDVKARLKPHEHQIELDEECSAMIDDQVRDCQRFVSVVLENVKGGRCAHSGDKLDAEKAGLQQQVRQYEAQQQKLLGVVGLLNKELQAIRHDRRTTTRDSILEKLLQDVAVLSEQLSSANRELQTSQRLVANLTMEKVQLEAELLDSRNCGAFNMGKKFGGYSWLRSADSTMRRLQYYFGNKWQQHADQDMEQVPALQKEVYWDNN